jgi:hypothetical protein
MVIYLSWKVCGEAVCIVALQLTVGGQAEGFPFTAQSYSLFKICVKISNKIAELTDLMG